MSSFPRSENLIFQTDCLKSLPECPLERVCLFGGDASVFFCHSSLLSFRVLETRKLEQKAGVGVGTLGTGGEKQKENFLY